MRAYSVKHGFGLATIRRAAKESKYAHVRALACACSVEGAVLKITWVQALLVAACCSFGLSCSIAAPFAILVEHAGAAAAFQAALEVSIGLFALEFPGILLILGQYKRQRARHEGGE